MTYRYSCIFTEDMKERASAVRTLLIDGGIDPKNAHEAACLGVTYSLGDSFEEAAEQAEVIIAERGWGSL